MNTVSHIVVDGRDLEKIRILYDNNGSEDTDIDETDLIIFRLLGVRFKYSDVEFID